MRQLAPLFGVSKTAADQIIVHLAPMLALQPRKRCRVVAVWHEGDTNPLIRSFNEIAAAAYRR